MNTLSRYLCLTFLRFFSVILAAMLMLYGLVEFIEKVDDFIEHQASLADFLWYPLYNLPLMLSYTLPLALLLGVFATIAALSRTNQLTAMLGCGINFARISRPLFLCGLGFCALTLLGSLWLVPWSVREAKYILETRLKGEVKVNTRSRDLIFRDGNQILRIAHSFPQRGELTGLSIIAFNEEFLPVRRLDAALAVHEEAGRWRFRNVAVWEFSPQDHSVLSFTRHAELTQDLQRGPEEMLQLWYDPEQMSAVKLREFIHKLQAEGYNAREYLVEEQMRIARAATPLIMVLLGIPFALRRGRQVSFSLGVTFSLAIFLVYFLLYALFAAIGNAAILPPSVAAWAANILMAMVGGWLFLGVRD